MELDDSFTEGLIQRSKARREYLSKKKAELVVGKKRSVLTDENQVNSDEPPNKSPKCHTGQSAYSPQNKENADKISGAPDVSAPKARGLAALKCNFLENEPVNKSPKYQSEENDDSNTPSVPVLSASRTRGLAALKNNYRGGEDEDAVSEYQDDPTTTPPVKRGTETCDGSTEKPENVKECSSGSMRDGSTQEPENEKEISSGSIDEEDFAENYDSIKSDYDCNTKMDQGDLPLKPNKADLKQKNFEPVQSLPHGIGHDVVDPAELPLSARRALFEKALMNGTPKVNKDITDHTLSVAERAAMFENASRRNCSPKKANFRETKCIARADLLNNKPGSPVKTVVKANLDTAKAPPLPTKHVGNHPSSIQKELIKKSDGSEMKGKEISVSVQGARKQEISNLVNRWEKLSSSSERTSSTEERKIVSFEDEDDSDAVEETSDDNLNEEPDDACSKDEQGDDCLNDFIPTTENVFYSPNAEQVSVGMEKISPALSQNTGSLMSSLSCSEISSYTDDRSSCTSGCTSGSSVRSYSINEEVSTNQKKIPETSGSQSCSSGSSVRTYDVNEEISENRKEKNPETPLLYTVSFYRKQKQETRLTPVQTIVRNRKEESSPASPDTPDCTKYIQERIKALQEEVLRQQTVISQASQALNLCSVTTEFSGSIEQVEGERLLLISTQKRQACLNEISRLKAFGTQGESVADGKGTLTITDLQLPLKREFIASQLEGKGTDAVHYFVCLIRHGEQVIVTQMMSSDDKTSDGLLCFTNHIQMQNLPADFSVIFEVYALQTKKEVLSHEKKYHLKREHSKIRLTPKGKKADGKILLPAVSSPGGPNAVRSPSFGVVGYTRFNLLNCAKNTFTLDKVPYTSPLEGVLRVRLQLHAEHRVLEKGFLTMFEDVSGLGAWYRRWCALDTTQILYWKYPDEEHRKEPVGMIDLKQCITSQVKLAPREICARPHTLQLVTVRPQEKGDKNTLISRSVNTLTTTRHLLSADTKEERILWCNKLNQALTSVRKWDPRALKPMEAPQD